MGTLRIVGQLVLALVLLISAGCGHNATVAQAPAPGAAATTGGWPAFPGAVAPGDSSATHAVSGAVSVFGTDYTAQDGANNYDDPLVPNAYVIIPGGGSAPVAYALYSIAGMDAERPVRVDLSVTAAPLTPGGNDILPLSYYVGISDFTSFTWHWSGPYTQDQTSITLNNEAGDIRDRCVSSDTSGNTFHLVIATTTGEEFVAPGNPDGLTAARIEQFTIHTLAVDDPLYSVTRPHFAAMTAIGPPLGKGLSALDPGRQYVQLDWVHLADPYRDELDADSYEVYRHIAGGGPALRIGSVAAPGAMYTDPTDNSAGVAEAIPGATYVYGLRAGNSAGFTPLSEREYTIPLLGPADVAASDGTYPDYIALSWTRAEGATGYKVFRDGQSEAELVATLGDVAAWDDTGVADFDVHTYWLRSVNAYQPQGGAWSDPDDGSRASGNQPPVADLAVTPPDPESLELVTLDASGSYDPDAGDSIVKYEFDFDEGGGWQDCGLNSSVTHRFMDARTYTLRVRVTDTHAAQDTASYDLSVHISGGEKGLETVPRIYSRGQVPPPYLQIFHDEPRVRRDPRMQIDIVNGVVAPVDFTAYSDMLKDAVSGEFSIYLQRIDVGGHPVYVPYPVIVIEETDYLVDITGPDDPDAIEGVSIPLAGGREAGRIAVDITTLINNLPPAEPGVVHRFYYKLYDAHGGEAGWGMFEVPPDPVEPPPPVGLAWGINVGDHSLWNLIDFNILALDFALDGSTMATPTPDMLWVRFNSATRMLDWDEYWGDGDASLDNVRLVLEDEEGATGSLGLRLVGQTGVMYDYFALAAMNRNDGAGYYYDWVASPPGAGILNPGHVYNVYLDDPSTAGLDFMFADQLSVIGTNPNLP